MSRPKIKRHKIMVVENDPADLQLMCGALRAEGYTVFPASSYISGINMFGTHMEEVELVITAVALPEKNGCELVKGLLRIVPSLKVLFVSGATGAQICRFYGRIGPAVEFLAKPLKRMEFLRVVRQMLEPGGVPIRTMSAG